MEKLLEMYEKETGVKSTASFEGSENLLPQVELKAVGDIFITHDPYMDYTFVKNALYLWTPVGYPSISAT